MKKTPNNPESKMTENPYNFDVKQPEVNKDTNNFNNNLKLLLPILSFGHPIHTSIVGGHIILVRGAVISHDEMQLWVICNDPHGSLTTPKSKYKDDNPHMAYYGAAYDAVKKTYSTSSATRKGRNQPKYGSDQGYSKGRHVYYSTHHYTRTESKENRQRTNLNFKYGVYMTYRDPRDADILTKDFVTLKLMKGRK